MMHRYGYSPSLAGENSLKNTMRLKKALCSKLVKPPVEDEKAFEAWVEAKIKIHNMDYWEIRKAAKAAKVTV